MLKVKKSWIGMFIWEVRELLDNNLYNDFEIYIHKKKWINISISNLKPDFLDISNQVESIVAGGSFIRT